MASNSRTPGSKKPLADRGDWYSLSLDTVRGWTIFFALIGVLIGGFFGYQLMQQLSKERKAMIVIEEAEALLARVQNEVGGTASGGAYSEAWQNLNQARRALSSGDHGEALVSARWSRNLFSSMLDDLRNQAPSGEAQFTSVRGGVEFRRGDGPWQVARSRIVLRSGDYVKTSGAGSAEVSFSDGTSFRVRPDTVILLSSRRGEGGAPAEDSVTLEYGWIKLDTTESTSRVRTPEAEAHVAEQSKVELTYDRDRRTGRFSSYEGSMEVRSRVGTIRRLGTREQVTLSARGMSSKVSLPPAPTLLYPDPEAALQLADERVILSWRRVSGASRYALQICRDHHFVDNVIDVEDRSRNTATVGLRDSGQFLWRVAAFNSQGYKGPWSEPQQFRVEGDLEALEQARRAGVG